MKKVFLIIFLLIVNISFADDIKIITKEIKDSSVALKYNISAVYPQLDGMSDKQIQENVNKIIFAAVDKSFKDYKNDLKDWDRTEIPLDVNSYLEIYFESYLLNDNVYSFAYEVDTYYAGAAHPNSYTISMNFDLKTGKPIVFNDLFNNKTKYLDKISSYCKEDLKLQAKYNGYEFDEDMLNDGAGPKDSNFFNFNFLQRGMQITFDTYTIAPYVFGTHCVLISYRTLFDIMNEEGILTKFNY